MVKLSYVIAELSSHTFISTVSLTEMKIFWTPTHDGKSSSLCQLALDPLKHLQSRAVQFTTIDGAVS